MADQTDYSDELALISMAEATLKTFVKAVLKALDDDKLSTREGLLLGAQGSSMGVTIAALFEGTTTDQRARLLEAWNLSMRVLKP